MTALFARTDTGAARQFPLLEAESPGIAEAWGAGYTDAQVRNSFSGAFYRAGRERLRGLAERLGPQGADAARQLDQLGFVSPAQAEALFAAARQAAEADPGVWADAPLSIEALDAQVTQALRLEQKQAQDTLDRTQGMASWVGFAGQLAGYVSDPVNLALMTLGAGAGSLARTVAIEAGLGAVAEGVNLPGQIAIEDRLGLKPAQPLTQVAMGAAFGATLPLAGRAVQLGWRAGRPILNDALLRAARSRTAELTPEARAAANVLEAEAQAAGAAGSAGLPPDAAAAALERTELALAVGSTGAAPDLSGQAAVSQPRTVGARIRQVESGGRADAANPNSSALGPDQFTRATWLEVARQHAPELFEGRSDTEVLALRTDPAISGRLREAHIRDIRAYLGERGLPVHDGALYLGWFAGRGGAARVLGAPPDAPLREALGDAAMAANASIRFRGKAFADITMQDGIDWARSKMGMGNAAFGDLPDPVGVNAYRADDVLVDAEAFQFKMGGDADGVTQRLLAETRWSRTAGSGLSFFEAADGRVFVADGHQRSGLARRLMAQGHEPIMLEGFVYREADGWTPAAVRAAAALDNIRAETGTAADAAKFLRDYPELAPELNRSRAFMRQADALSRLAPDSFMAVINGVIPENFGAVIGRVAPGDERLQAAMLRAFRQLEPANEAQADMMARDVRRLGLEREAAGAQGDLFADFDFGASPIAERARVLDRTVAELKRDKAVFDRLTREADRIEQEGNKLARTQNEQRAQQNQRILEAILIAADEPGIVRDALDAAARTARTGTVSAAAREFAEAVRGAIDSGDIGRAFDRAATRGAAAAPGNGGVAPNVDPGVSARAAAEALGESNPRGLSAAIADAGETPRDLFGDPDAPAMAAAIKDLADTVAPPRAAEAPDADAAVGDLFGGGAQQRDVAPAARPAPERLAERLTPDEAAVPMEWDAQGRPTATVGDLLAQLDEEAEALDIVETLCGLPGGAA